MVLSRGCVSRVACGPSPADGGLTADTGGSNGAGDESSRSGSKTTEDRWPLKYNSIFGNGSAVTPGTGGEGGGGSGMPSTLASVIFRFSERDCSISCIRPSITISTFSTSVAIVASRSCSLNLVPVLTDNSSICSRRSFSRPQILRRAFAASSSDSMVKADRSSGERSARDISPRPSRTRRIPACSGVTAKVACTRSGTRPRSSCSLF